MNRRAAMLALAAAAVVPRAVAQARTRVVGYLSNGADASWLAKHLSALGQVEGRGFRIEWRATSSDGVHENARELLAARPDVLVAFGAHNVGALAALTKTIPIVCGGTSDPVGIGYAKTLRRPGGNITGLSYGVPESAEIIIGLMKRIKPEASAVTAFVARTGREDLRQGWQRVMASLVDRARSAGISWEWEPIASNEDLERMVEKLDPRRSMAYFMTYPPDLDVARAFAAVKRRRLASWSGSSSPVRAGALMHYSVTHADPQRRVASMVDRLLRGADPAEMPFELPDRTSFVVNRATAEAIGITLPPDILARATEIVG